MYFSRINEIFLLFHFFPSFFSPLLLFFLFYSLPLPFPFLFPSPPSHSLMLLFKVFSSFPHLLKCYYVPHTMDVSRMHMFLPRGTHINLLLFNLNHERSSFLHSLLFPTSLLCSLCLLPLHMLGSEVH